MSPDELNALMERGTILHIPKGDTICSEGEPGSYVFVILHGSVSIYRKSKMIAKCKDYDAFGEMSVLNGRPRSATAKATTQVELLALDEMEVNKILGSEIAVRFLLNIIQVLSERLEVGNTWIATSLESMRRPRVSADEAEAE